MGVNGFYPDNKPFTVKQGQQATMAFTNKTRMWHPMHLHGHTFQMLNDKGELGARKDTVIVLPGQSVKTPSSPTTPDTGRCTATTPITPKRAWRTPSTT